MKEWTPIEQGLPPMGVALFVTIYDKLNFTSKVLYPVYYIDTPYNMGFGFAFEQFENKLNPDYNEVKAWMIPPKPYEFTVDNEQ